VKFLRCVFAFCLVNHIALEELLENHSKHACCIGSDPPMYFEGSVIDFAAAGDADDDDGTSDIPIQFWKNPSDHAKIHGDHFGFDTHQLLSGPEAEARILELDPRLCGLSAHVCIGLFTLSLPSAT